ncbi:VOC family protein [Massilia sp. TN1-12]|uniref:VOC family protein n=1 Tax=Massilia paldalensis TaxID=3377675 RepID=UPI003850F57E
MSEDNVQAVPPGMHSLTPHLVCANAAAAIDFYRQAFGAEEIMRLPMPDGKLGHAMLRIGDSMLMLADEFPQWESHSPATLRGSPVTIHLAVPDVDATFEQAIAAGAQARMAPADMFWGDRYGVLVDPFGHHWSVATHVRDVPVEEMRAEMERMFAGGVRA